MPNSRAIWIVAAMAAAWGGVMFATAKVTSDVRPMARPTASTIWEGRKSPPAQSWVRPVSIQLPIAIRAKPMARRRRASIRRSASTTSGMITNCGRAIQFSTSPICSARRPWIRVR